MRSPVFFVGPRKTGTTSLYEIFLQQGVPMTTRVKETFFFQAPDPDLTAYQQRFGIDPATPFVEISPSYFRNATARDNLRRLFPTARVVVTLRNPVDRALSAVAHLRREGLLDRNIEGRAFRDNKQVRAILDGSAYRRHVDLWSQALPGQVLRIRQSEDKSYSPNALEELADFVSVRIDANAVSTRKANRSRDARSVRLIRVARRVRGELRRRGADRVVQALRPLNSVLYRTSAGNKTTDDERRFFEDALAPEVDYYTSIPEAVRL